MNFTAPAPSPAADDASLVARYVAGDDHAFALLLSRYQSRVFTTLLLMVRDEDLAEDLTQDTFLRVVKTLRTGKYQHNGHFGAWVCRIAHNLAIDSLRRASNRLTVSLNTPPPTGHFDSNVPTRAAFVADTTEPSPEAAFIRTEAEDELRRFIDALPAQQRQVLLLRHYSELSFQEIAETAGISVSAALGRMRYAIINLRRLMRPSATGSASMLLALALTASAFTAPITTARPGRITRTETFPYTISDPNADSDDSTFYPGDADPVRLQRLA